MLEYRQLDPKKQTSVTFYSKFKYLHSRKCIWNRRLRETRPFCPWGDELKILFTQYTCASLWWQLVLNTANLWVQLTLKAAVATHVLDVFTGWFTPSTGLARVLRIICQKSHNLVRLSDEYILCCDLDYENFDLDPERVIKYNTRGALLPPWINFNPSMDKYSHA